MEKTFLITWVTHNSRVSERMVEFGVKKGAPVLLNDEEEELVVKVLAEVAEEKALKILACNICRDHVHMVLACEREDIPNIMQFLKGRSARELNVFLSKGLKPPCSEDRQDIDILGNKGFQPLDHEQKDLSKGLKPPCCKGNQNVDILGNKGFQPLEHERSEKEPRHVWAQKYHAQCLDNETALANAIEYVQYNRLKHDLPPNHRTHQWIRKMVSSYLEVFGEY